MALRGAPRCLRESNTPTPLARQDLEASAKEQKDTEESIATSEAFIEETTAASEVPAHRHFTRG